MDLSSKFNDLEERPDMIEEEKDEVFSPILDFASSMRKMSSASFANKTGSIARLTSFEVPEIKQNQAVFLETEKIDSNVEAVQAVIAAGGQFTDA
jgi:hypothetical protein